jgi:hypothetical protein
MRSGFQWWAPGLTASITGRTPETIERQKPTVSPSDAFVHEAKPAAGMRNPLPSAPAASN